VLAEEPDAVLRQVASRALVATATASEDRTRGLRDRDAGVRLATLAALASAMQGEPEAALITAVEERLSADGWPQVRRVAAEARAAACRAPAQNPALRKAVLDADEQVQKQAFIGLAKCEGAGAVDFLAQWTEPDSKRRSSAGLRGLSCVLLSRHGFSATSAEVRARAHRGAAAALSTLLEDPAADERHAAALGQCVRSIGEAGDFTDVPVLLQVIDSEIPAPLRQGALHAMAGICARSGALPPPLRKRVNSTLKAALKDSEKLVQSAAQRATAACH
jgi:hypothetical protein